MAAALRVENGMNFTASSFAHLADKKTNMDSVRRNTSRPRRLLIGKDAMTLCDPSPNRTALRVYLSL